MKICRPRDTVAWRIAASISAVIAVTCCVIALFLNFGGEWVRPPLDLRSIMDGVVAVTNMMDATPPEQRPALVAVAHPENYRLQWFAAKDAAWFAAAMKRDMQLDDDTLNMIKVQIHRPFIVIGPDLPVKPDASASLTVPPGGDGHFLAVRLHDGSWLVFAGSKKNLSPAARVTMRLILFLLVAIGIGALATYQISQPIRRLAKEVHAKGANPNGVPITESGPQELREVIAAVNSMQAKIAAFVAYRTAMLAAISHDLRTPLTRMRLRGEYVADPVQRQRLFADVDEMQGMIDGALALFRGDGDEEAVRSFDLSGVLLSIVDGFADQGIEVGYAGGDHIVYSGRAISIKRAITNLVENAVKYGTAPVIALRKDETAITITVCDRGPGIPGESLEAVFEPFFRLDKSRHKARGGVGLGLTAARTIIRGHGGDIVLRNRDGGGLEATVTLPVSAS